MSSDSNVDAQRRKTFENVKEIFAGHISETVIVRVLEECDWKGNDCESVRKQDPKCF